VKLNEAIKIAQREVNKDPSAFGWWGVVEIGPDEYEPRKLGFAPDNPPNIALYVFRQLPQHMED
jgi:hypothetical protein